MYVYRQTVTALAGASSDPVILPSNLEEVVVTALPGGGGTATIQHTTDERAAVEADPASANWVNWDPGGVTAATSRALVGPVTALRIQAVTANATMQVVGGRVR